MRLRQPASSRQDRARSGFQVLEETVSGGSFRLEVTMLPGTTAQVEAHGRMELFHLDDKESVRWRRAASFTCLLCAVRRRSCRSSIPSDIRKLISSG